MSLHTMPGSQCTRLYGPVRLCGPMCDHNPSRLADLHISRGLAVLLSPAFMAPSKMYTSVLAAGFASMSFAVGRRIQPLVVLSLYFGAYLDSVCFCYIHQANVSCHNRTKTGPLHRTTTSTSSMDTSPAVRQGRENMQCTPVRLHQV